MSITAWKAHDDIIMCAEFIDGHIVSGAKDNLIKLWRTGEANKTPELLCVYSGHTASISGLSMAQKDLSMVASVSSDNTLKIWDSLKIVTQGFSSSFINFS